MSNHRAALGSNPLQSDLLPNLSPAVSAVLFGDTFGRKQDGERLTTQYQRVEAIMADGYWRTLPGICTEIHKRFPGSHYAETAISARLRDMRRRGWKVEHERIRANSGLYQYRAVKLEVAA
jgi:hypothetical protein